MRLWRVTPLGHDRFWLSRQSTEMGNQVQSEGSTVRSEVRSQTKGTVNETIIGVDSTMHGQTKGAVNESIAVVVDSTMLGQTKGAVNGPIEIAVDDTTVGVALLISNDYIKPEISEDSHLPLTHREADELGKLFEEFGYVVYKRKNVSKQELSTHCRKLSEYAYQLSCRRIVVYFSGHGNDGTLFMQDGSEVNITEIIERFKPFAADNEVLGLMARIFLFDSCRGDAVDTGYCPKETSSKKSLNQITCVRKLPYEGNTLVAYASTQHYPSYYGSHSGSFWTSSLIKALKESKQADSLCTILTMANGILSQKQSDGAFQTATFTSNLRDEVFFRKEAMDREQQYKGEC